MPDELIYEPLPDGWAYDSSRNVYFRRDDKEVQQVGEKWRACHEGAELFDYPGYAIKDLDHNCPIESVGYEGYQDIMVEMGGKKVDKGARKKAREEAGITTQDVSFRGSGNDWYGTVYFLKGEPMEILYYVWEAPDITKSLGEALGYSVKLKDHAGGNGHYSARVVRDET